MKFIDKFIRTVEIALRSSTASGEAGDMDIDKQNTPPDEHDAEMDEAAHEQETVLSAIAARGSETDASGKAKTKNA